MVHYLGLTKYADYKNVDISLNPETETKASY